MPSFMDILRGAGRFTQGFANPDASREKRRLAEEAAREEEERKRKAILELSQIIGDTAFDLGLEDVLPNDRVATSTPIPEIAGPSQHSQVGTGDPRMDTLVNTLSDVLGLGSDEAAQSFGLGEVLGSAKGAGQEREFQTEVDQENRKRDLTRESRIKDKVGLEEGTREAEVETLREKEGVRFLFDKAMDSVRRAGQKDVASFQEGLRRSRPDSGGEGSDRFGGRSDMVTQVGITLRNISTQAEARGDDPIAAVEGYLDNIRGRPGSEYNRIAESLGNQAIDAMKKEREEEGGEFDTAAAQKACEAKGWEWNAATRTCTKPGGEISSATGASSRDVFEEEFRRVFGEDLA